VVHGWLITQNQKSIAASLARRHCRLSGVVALCDVANWGELIFLDDKLLGDLSGELVGATAYQTDLAVATTDRVHFYDQEGLHVDTLDEITLPEGDLQAIDVSKEGALMVWVNDASYRYDESLTSYDAEGKAINHPPSGMLPLKHDAQNSLRESLAKTAEIPWSRVLLDAHSGKLFDPVGRYVVTLATLALIALIISGLRLFPRRRRGRS